MITVDGRHLIGTLAGSDPVMNLILENSEEMIYSLTDPVEVVPMGLMVIRGDNL